MLVSPSEKQGGQPEALQKADAGHKNNGKTRKEKSQPTNPSQRYKENPHGWHDQ